MKRMIVSIGYTDYALSSAEDAVNLLAIAGRAIRVRREHYNTPYLPVPDQSPAVEAISLSEYDDSRQFLGDEPAPRAPATPEDEIAF